MGLRKTRDLIIHRNDAYYCGPESYALALQNGELMVGFRMTKNRLRQLPQPPEGKVGVIHADPNSRAVYVKSRDGGKTWDAEPTAIYYDWCGSQGAVLTRLNDGTIICTTFRWEIYPLYMRDKLGPFCHIEDSGWPMLSLGTAVLRSKDNGLTWDGPHFVENPGFESNLYVRGTILELPDGSLLMPAAATKRAGETSRSIVLKSKDKGLTWKYYSEIAYDEENKIHFQEPFIHRTPSGKIIAMLRTEGAGGYLFTATSKDDGETWNKFRRESVWGEPFHMLRLRSGRVLCTYGYRRSPYGVRARLLSPECSDLNEAPEFIIRDDGGNWDVGYPSALQMPDDSILVTYYFNLGGAYATRYIAGSIIREA